MSEIDILNMRVCALEDEVRALQAHLSRLSRRVDPSKGDDGRLKDKPHETKKRIVHLLSIHGPLSVSVIANRLKMDPKSRILATSINELLYSGAVSKTKSKRVYRGEYVEQLRIS